MSSIEIWFILRLSIALLSLQKPSNLLVNSDCSLRICDFGLARLARPIEDDTPLNEVPMMTEYSKSLVVYNLSLIFQDTSPRVGIVLLKLSSLGNNTLALSIYGLSAAFLLSYYRENPFFRLALVSSLFSSFSLQGFDYMHQVNKIVEVLGSPSPDDLAAIHNHAARKYIEDLGYRPPASWHRMFPQISNPQGVLFLVFPVYFHFHRVSVVRQYACF